MTERLRPYGPPLAAALAGLAVVGALFLFPYLTRDLSYPLAGSAPKYVAKARWVAENGLDMVGMIRTGASLLTASLDHLTGRNAFTLLAVLPPLLAGVAGLGAAAMLRAALGLRAPWVPVVAVLTWTAFIDNGMVGLRFDNLVTATLVLPAFAAVLSWAGWRRGAVAAGLLLGAAGMAHWPFYVFAAAVLVTAVAAWTVWPLGGPREGSVRRFLSTAPVLWAAGGSAALVAASFLSPPSTGWLGLRSLGHLKTRLQENLLKLGDRSIYASVPLAAAGAYASVRSGAPVERPGARRLFIVLMATWFGATVAAVILQFAGLPTAGARLIEFLFPLSILTGVLVWWAARWLVAHVHGAAGLVAGGLVVALAVGGFGAFTVRWWQTKDTFVDPRGAAQAAAAGEYLDRVVPGHQAVFIMDRRLSRGPLSFQVIQAMVPPDQNARIFASFARPETFEAGPPSKARRTLQFGPATGRLRPDVVGVVLERFHPNGFARMRASAPRREVAPGVVVLHGPAPSAPLPIPAPPTADVAPGGLLLAVLLVTAALFAVGGGWAGALLPPDPLLRVLIAPALGAAALILGTLVWDRVGLPFGGRILVIPAALLAAAGWGAAWRRGRAAPSGQA